MHEARGVNSGRQRVLLAGVSVLIVVALLLLLRQRQYSAIGVNGAAATPSLISGTAGESAAEKARRAAIAAQGPIKRRNGTNAADLYKQAIELYAGLTDQEKGQLKRDAQPDAKTAAALFAKIQPIMDLLRRGRNADYVDWGLGGTGLQGMGNRTAQMTSIQQLALLARWDATYLVQSDPAGAISDMAAMDALGRSSDDSLLGLLVEDGIHEAGLEWLAQNAAAIPNADAIDFGAIVDSAAVEQGFQNGINGEAAMVQEMLNEYADPASRPQVEQYFHTGSITPQEAVSEMEWLAQTEQALGNTLEEPDVQFQQWWTQKQAEASSMPLASPALASLALARNVAQVSLVESPMLEAGLAMEQGNQAQFQSFVDPSTGRPFSYTQTANGFQLASPLQYKGKPVTLDFGTPAPK